MFCDSPGPVPDAAERSAIRALGHPNREKERSLSRKRPDGIGGAQSAFPISRNGVLLHRLSGVRGRLESRHFGQAEENHLFAR
jgi:hypothetical protein